MEITKLRLSNSLSPKDERNDGDAYGFSREHRSSSSSTNRLRWECEEAEEDERGGYETVVRNPTKHVVVECNGVFEERERMEEMDEERERERERNWRCFEVLSFRRRVLSARAGAC